MHISMEKPLYRWMYAAEKEYTRTECEYDTFALNIIKTVQNLCHMRCLNNKIYDDPLFSRI